MAIKLTTENFIQRAKLVHGDKYDYSKVNYINAKTNIIVICKKHGEFNQNSHGHLSGRGCFKCSYNILSNEEFIQKVKEIHHDKYIYNLVNYINTKNIINIICPIHGEFKQRPDSHLSGAGCKKCAIDAMNSNSELFIIKANLIHNNIYDYSKVVYINNKSKVTIICPIHGDFNQEPSKHLTGQSCGKCCKFGVSGKLTQEYVIEQFKKSHFDKYDYSFVEYINELTKVKIICKTHGIFRCLPLNHKRGVGCPKCVIRPTKLSYNTLTKQLENINKDIYIPTKSGRLVSDIKIIVINKHYNTKHLLTPKSLLNGTKCTIINAIDKTAYLIKEFVEAHSNKYFYGNVIYLGKDKEVSISCPIHGEFKQTPISHKKGNGCQKCKESKGEKAIRIILETNSIEYIHQHKFINCKIKRPLPFDFYLPKFNTCIEFNGEQHYKPVKYFGYEKFKKQIISDKIKMEYCHDNNIPLIIIKYNENIEERLHELF